MTDAIDNNQNILAKILLIVEELNHYKDLDALLDRVLLEARRLTQADAGSIYLVNNNVLNFSYTHNDTLFTSTSNKHIYASQVLEINNKSIAGYVASAGKALKIDDAYHIPESLPFTFNGSFDTRSGYLTKSILTIPLITSRGKIVGVLQIINALNDKGEVVSFTEQDQLVLSYFSNNAAVAIERAMIAREIILRMIKMCEFRDPSETGAHANRVAAYSAEIYQKWALLKNIPEAEIKKTRDVLRIAAMLHDLGKVAISDVILKKPGKLNDAEFQVMKYHTIHGARFFENPNSDLDVISAEIALNHHERWDGRGYPGKIANIFEEKVSLGTGKQGEEIPIYGRIVALADVYDALMSKRAYKEPLPEDQVLEYLRAESGRQFDPDVVEAFFAIYEVIIAIRQKYQENPAAPRLSVEPSG
jgi:HD-GYP domain-containing protein (c-di-GMP phosphodiesterase class II)